MCQSIGMIWFGSRSEKARRGWCAMYYPALVPQLYQWGIVERIERGLR
jgi:hypothetical protein